MGFGTLWVGGGGGVGFFSKTYLNLPFFFDFLSFWSAVGPVVSHTPGGVVRNFLWFLFMRLLSRYALSKAKAFLWATRLLNTDGLQSAASAEAEGRCRQSWNVAIPATIYRSAQGPVVESAPKSTFWVLLGTWLGVPQRVLRRALFGTKRILFRALSGPDSRHSCTSRHKTNTCRKHFLGN